MTVAWKSDIASGRKMVLLALCDNANDQGECFPSVSMLAEKCSMSERSVFSHIADLEKQGAIRRENRNGRSTVYHLDPCKFCTPANSAPLQPLHTTPANISPPPLQILHPTPATVAPITINEPSIEPETKNTTPEGVSVSVWRDFQKLRKGLRAPITDTAMAGIRREALAAGVSLEAALQTCCERGWRGFKAAWMADKPQARASPSETTYQRTMREKWEVATGRNKKQEVIYDDAKLLG